MWVLQEFRELGHDDYEVRSASIMGTFFKH
jgi:hypothetical protein